MNWAIEYIERDRYVKVTCKGVFSLDEQPLWYKKLFSVAFWRPGLNLLFDNRSLDFGTINFEIMRAASRQYLDVSHQLGRGRLALLMKSAHDFGIGRQFEMISEGKGEREICIFRDEQAAVKWLLSLDSSCVAPAM